MNAWESIQMMKSELAHLDEDISEWQEWANAKADWYDPTISREDELLGKRDHAKAKDEKRQNIPDIGGKRRPDSCK